MLTDKEQIEIGRQIINAVSEVCHGLEYTDKSKHNPSMYANACTAIEGLAKAFLTLRSYSDK